MAASSWEGMILSILSKLNVDRQHHKRVASKSLEIRRQMENKLVGSLGDKRVPVTTRDVIASHLALEDQGIHVKIEDVIRISTCKSRGNYLEAKRSALTAIGSSVNLKHKSLDSLAVVSGMDGLFRGAQVLIAGLEKQCLSEGQPKGYYNTSRYHAGALWLETLRTGNEKGIKKPTLMEEGGLTPRELDDIAAAIAAANNLLKDRLIETALAQSISSMAPYLPLGSSKKRRYPYESPRQNSLLDSNSSFGRRVTTSTVTKANPRFSCMGNTRVGGIHQRRTSLMNGNVLDGKMTRHNSPKSKVVDGGSENPMPSEDGIELNVQEAMVLESNKTMQHTDVTQTTPSKACNIKEEKRSAVTYMIGDTKNILRKLSSQDREKLLRLHSDELVQATS